MRIQNDVRTRATPAAGAETRPAPAAEAPVATAYPPLEPSKRLARVSAPLGGTTSGSDEARRAGAEAVFAAPTAMAAASPSPSIDAFRPLAPPQLAASPACTLKLTCLEPNRTYDYVALRRHPYDASKLLCTNGDARASADGAIDLGERALERALRRSPTDFERTFGGSIAVRAMTEITKANVPPAWAAMAALLESKDGDDHLLFTATPRPDTTLAQAEPALMRQTFLALPPGTRRIELDPVKDGLVGYLLIPPHAPGSRLPACQVVGGSGGTIPHGRAALYAAQGCVVLATRYFTYDKSDPAIAHGAINYLIDRLPLENIERALTYMAQLPFVDAKRMSFSGESRGGELAFLVAQYLGNRYALENVLAYRPLDVVVGSKINGPDFPGGDEQTSWTFGGRALPFVAKAKDVEQFPEVVELAKQNGTLRYEEVNGVRLPVARLRAGFEAYLPSHSTIDISRYNGRVMAIGATDDALWPSEVAVRRIAEQRRDRDSDVMINIVGAGHYAAPERPTTAIPDEVRFENGSAKDPRPNQHLLVPNGGTPERNALYDVLNSCAGINMLRGEPKAPLPFQEIIEDRHR